VFVAYSSSFSFPPVDQRKPPSLGNLVTAPLAYVSHACMRMRVQRNGENFENLQAHGRVARCGHRLWGLWAARGVGFGCNSVLRVRLAYYRTHISVISPSPHKLLLYPASSPTAHKCTSHTAICGRIAETRKHISTIYPLILP